MCAAAVEPGACFLGSTNLLNIAMAFGLSIFVLVYAAASFSGKHTGRKCQALPQLSSDCQCYSQ